MTIGLRSRVAGMGFAAALALAFTCAPGQAQQSHLPPSKEGPSKDDVPPLAGANSFVEGQARKLLETQGFAEISPLVNDSQGIWRGTAMSGSKKVDVAVDYKGNVTAQPK